MDVTPSQSFNVKLSICITTLNRAKFIGATLDSILAQATDSFEVVVLDAASTDGTTQVVAEYARRFECLRYVRQDTNNGIDRDYDHVVEIATGEYCWLMTDDDLLMPHAVETVLQGLERNPSLVFVNAELRDLSLSRIVHPRWIDMKSDRVYASHDMDSLFLDVGDALRYIGGVVINRSLWLTRSRERYYGSLFIHIGVIFQEPLPGGALVIADPLIIYRDGNTHAWSPKVFETLMITWPALVWSFSLSNATKSKVRSAEPWKNIEELLMLRGCGCYSLGDYRRWIRPRLRSVGGGVIPIFVAMLPGAIVNALLFAYYTMTGRQYLGVWQADVVLQSLRNSRFHFRNWRVLTRSRIFEG